MVRWASLLKTLYIYPLLLPLVLQTGTCLAAPPSVEHFQDSTGNGATDGFGFQAVENTVHVHDLHATILHLLGLDHERLVFPHAGLDHRLTDLHGKVIHGLLA